MPETVRANVPRGVLPLVLSVNTLLPPAPPGIKAEGEKVQVAAAGNPEHESVTAELNASPKEFAVTLKVTDCPCFTLALVGTAATEKSTPTPLRLALWGLPAALSLMLSTPD